VPPVRWTSLPDRRRAVPGSSIPLVSRDHVEPGMRGRCRARRLRRRASRVREHRKLGRLGAEVKQAPPVLARAPRGRAASPARVRQASAASGRRPQSRAMPGSSSSSLPPPIRPPHCSREEAVADDGRRSCGRLLDRRAVGRGDEGDREVADVPPGLARAARRLGDRRLEPRAEPIALAPVMRDSPLGSRHRLPRAV
jgi:hypothetical protein